MQNLLTGNVGVERPLVVTNPLDNAINVTDTATAEQITGGVITSTSAAAVTITTPTAAAIAAALGFIGGTFF
ncbi:MAG: hypothetical protein KGI54_18655, partial [Pseudomonadota bacterium]|nr:hypothetical protein [Pseudomonadota bacterium]